MYSQFWPKGGLPGLLHHYVSTELLAIALSSRLTAAFPSPQTESLVTFEYTSNAIRQPHSLVFLGGLGDGLATTSYMADLVQALQKTEWSVFSLNLTSSYQSWGLGHLDRDTNEIAQCLNYIKDYKSEKYGTGKIVLMGHSTGSQCVLHYLSQPNPHTSTPAFDSGLQHINRMPLDGAIMQAPVSDREAIFWVLTHGIGGKSPSEIRAVYDKMEALAKEAARNDTTFDTMLPLSLTSNIYPGNTAISARRFLSLISLESPQSPSEDDLFSSDLSDEQLGKTFGMIKEQGLLKHKLMVLFSGADQSVPDWIDKDNLLKRWRNATNHGSDASVWDDDHSAIIPNASHALSNDDQAEPRKFLVEKVLGYLGTA